MNQYSLENHLQNIVITEYLSKLDWRRRKIILLYYWWGYRDGEIGEMLGLSQQVVHYQRSKALKELKYQMIESSNERCSAQIVPSLHTRNH